MTNFKEIIMDEINKIGSNFGFEIIVSKRPTINQIEELYEIANADPEDLSDKEREEMECGVCGVTRIPELDDSCKTDNVEFFEDCLVYFFNHHLMMMSERGYDLEALIRSIVRHELRHCEQIKELRRLGYDLNQVSEVEMSFEYGKGPMEYDALYTQFKGRVPIENFIKIFEAAYAFYKVS